MTKVIRKDNPGHTKAPVHIKQLIFLCFTEVRPEHDREACLKGVGAADTAPRKVRSITRADYARLTGRTKEQAIAELNGFLAEGKLRKYGSGKTVVYLSAGSPE